PRGPDLRSRLIPSGKRNPPQRGRPQTPERPDAASCTRALHPREAVWHAGRQRADARGGLAHPQAEQGEGAAAGAGGAPQAAAGARRAARPADGSLIAPNRIPPCSRRRLPRGGGGVFASRVPLPAGRMQRELAPARGKPLALVGKTGRLDLSSRPGRRGTAGPPHHGRGSCTRPRRARGPTRRRVLNMRRRDLAALLALAGLLLSGTGCQSTVRFLKANYAAKQGNDLYKAQDFPKAIEWYRYATYLNPDLDLAY